MDNALQALLSWQFIVFCLSVVAVTYVVRTVVDYILHNRGYDPKSSHLWVELILPILPVFLGSFGAILAKQYPYPLDISSGSGRFAFGLCAGLLSGLVWRVIKSMINAKLTGLQNTPISAVIAPDVGDGASAEKANEPEQK